MQLYKGLELRVTGNSKEFMLHIPEARPKHCAGLMTMLMWTRLALECLRHMALELLLEI